MKLFRKFYRLPDLAERWGRSVNDLLHSASLGHLLIYVDAAGFVGKMMPLRTEHERPSALRLRSALLGLDRRVARQLEQPGAFPFKLDIATFSPDWTGDKSWLVEFFPQFEIVPGNLCVLSEQADRYEESDKNKKKATSELSLKTVERDSLLKIIYSMAIAEPYGFDPSAKRNEATAIIASATGAAGCPVDVDTVRKWLKLAAKEHGKPNTGSH